MRLSNETATSEFGTFETSIDCSVYGRFREQCGHQPPIADIAIYEYAP
jgi:hypothetical protein